MAQTKPVVTANILSARQSQAVDERSILVIGQLNGGTATSGQLVEGLISESQFNDYFGRTSHISKAGRAVLDKLSVSRTKPRIDAIALSDAGAAVNSTGTITFVGTATAAGTISVYIDSTKNGKYQVAVSSGDSITAIGNTLEALITANLDSPVSASNAAGTVTLTALNGGTEGNDIGIRYEGLVAGITTSTTAMASGATNPVLTNLFDSITDKRYTSIVYPESWGTSTLTDFLEPRFNVDDNILDGVGIVSKKDTFANLNTALDGLNLRTLAYIPNKLNDDSDYRGGGIFESSIVISARKAAERELRLTVGSNTSSIVTNGQGTGGSFFSSIPYANTPDTGLPVITTGKGFTDAEALELRNSGGWLLRNNPNNTILISGEAVTTYKTDVLANPDNTFKFLNFVDTLSITREYIFNNAKADFTQRVLTNGNVVAGSAQVNAQMITTQFMTYYGTLSGMDGSTEYLTLINSEEARKAYKAEIENSISINLSTGTVTVDQIANIVSQLRNLIINITPTFE